MDEKSSVEAIIGIVLYYFDTDWKLVVNAEEGYGDGGGESLFDESLCSEAVVSDGEFEDGILDVCIVVEFSERFIEDHEGVLADEYLDKGEKFAF
jgi:hypothetical protein